MLSLDGTNDHSKRIKSIEAPLPWKQLGILLLLNLAEPISATIIYPFIAQLVEELGVAKDSVGYYVGLVESLFFLTEAMFVLQWGRLSDRIGRKPVLVLGLLGLALSMISFGLSHSFLTIVISRALAGALNANTGILKCAVGEIADESNLARALSFIPLAWFFGTTIAPLAGGYLSHPAERFPALFKNCFWESNPYFLPCGIAAAFSLACAIVALLFLKETKPRISITRYHTFQRTDSEATLFSECGNDEEAPLLSLPKESKSSSLPTAAPPLRDLLIKPVLLAVLNYGLLALLDISFQSLLPIFLAGSLHLSPSSIGVILGTMGLVNGVVQILLFVPLHRRFGSRTILTVGMCSFVIIFLLFPIISRVYTRNGDQLGLNGNILIAVQMALCPIENMAYNVIFLYVQAASPSKDTLGATNGISQTAASIARAIGPASATSLFALSMQRQDIAGGNLVYCVLIALTVIAAGVSRMLPAEPWQKAADKE